MTGGTDHKDWRDGVRLRRADTLAAERAAQGRATIFDFIGIGSDKTWISGVNVAPGSNTGPHDHGRHEVMIYVVKGRSEIRWGDALEYAAEIGPGDAVYFAPFVPHQERSLEAADVVEYLVVRSDNERIVNPRAEIAAVDRPERL